MRILPRLRQVEYQDVVQVPLRFLALSEAERRVLRFFLETS